MRNALVALRRRSGGDGGSKRFRILHRRLRDERGTTIVELGVAMLVLSVAVIGVVGSMGLGMSLSGSSRQRSSGSAIASERIERARNLSCTGLNAKVCYSHIAINDPDHPVTHTTNGSPDDNVTADNSSYVVTSGTTEPLNVDSVNGGLNHIEDPITVGVTKFSIYQYVTWVDDPNIPSSPCPLPSTATTCDYKRVTVVVTWKNPVKAGIPNSVTQSTFVSDGTITLPGVTPTPAAGSPPVPTPTPTATPTPTSGLCSDGIPPTGSISALDGAVAATAGFTNVTSVTVQLTATDPCGPITGALSNTNGGFTDVKTFASGTTSTVTWTIPAVEGSRTIYAQFRDGGNATTTTTISATITYDKTPPSVPSSFSAPGNLRNHTGSPAKSGSNCVFTMDWDNTATDINLVGYRVYRQIDGGAFTAPVNTSSPYQTTVDKQHAYAYIVRAYDAAGNESADSNPLSFGTAGANGSNGSSC